MTAVVKTVADTGAGVDTGTPQALIDAETLAEAGAGADSASPLVILAGSVAFRGWGAPVGPGATVAGTSPVFTAASPPAGVLGGASYVDLGGGVGVLYLDGADTVVNNGDGTATVTSATFTGVTDNGDGTQTVTLTSTYSYQFAATGSTPIIFTVTGGALPTGLTLSPGGLLAGTPAVAGVFAFTVTASNGVSPSAVAACSVTVAGVTTVALPAKVTGGYWKMAGTQTVAQVHPAFNLIYLAYAEADGATGAVKLFTLDSGYTTAQLKADIAAKRAAGTAVILSIGGTSIIPTVSFTSAAHVTAFIASIQALMISIGPFDGIDIDLVDNAALAYPALLVSACQQLKALWPRFIVSYCAAAPGWITAGPAACTALNNAGALDVVSVANGWWPATTDAQKLTLTAETLNYWGTLIGGDYNRTLLEFVLNTTSTSDNTMTTALAVTAWNQTKTAHPGIRGAFVWTTLDDAAQGDPFAATLGPLIVGGASVPPVFTASSPPSATVGVAYTYQFAASGTTPITFTPTTGSIPAGLTLSPAGMLSGTPTTAGTSSFVVTASNGVAPNATASCTVVAAPGSTGTPPTFTAAAPPSAVVGSFYTYQFAASGTTPITFTPTSGSLPAGLTLTTAGVLSGTPTTAGTSSFVVTASNGVTPAGTATCTVTVAAAVVAPLFTAAAPPDGVQGVAYSYTFRASGSPAPTFSYTTFTTPGGLPTGCTLSSAGVLSGIPAYSGQAIFRVIASNGVLPDATVDITMTIAVAASPPVFTASSPPGGTVGVAYTYQFAATGTAPVTFARTAGSLPAGLTLTAAGLLSGTPTTAASSSFTVTASNSGGSAAAACNVTVASGGGGGWEWLGDFSTGNGSQWPSHEYKDGATAADQARQQQYATAFTVAGTAVTPRAGFPYMGKFQVISSDQTSGDPGRNRSEVTDYGEIFARTEGTTKWWGWSMWLAPNFYVDPNAESPGGNGWLICTQWHSDIGSPPIAFLFTKPADHIPHLIIETKSDSRDRIMPGAMPRGVWNDFRVGVTFGTTTSNGHLIVRMRSNYGSWSTLVDEGSATLDSSRVCNLKQGIYRATANRADDIIFCGCRRGNTEASVTY